MYNGIFTNRNSQKDFIINAITQYSSVTSDVKIACPFFTAIETTMKLVKMGCRLKLIVRLGFPTDPKALTSVLSHPQIEVRYFTDRTFHSKLYIFGDQIALVGSANFTKAALEDNQEILLTIPSDDLRFEELASLFAEYWEDAKVLTSQDVLNYSQLWTKYDDATSSVYQFENEIVKLIGRVVSGNIVRFSKKEARGDIFLETYRKTYQESTAAFDHLRSIYESHGVRKVPEELIPLRLEIDSFVSYVREKHAREDKWLEQLKLDDKGRHAKIDEFMKEWFSTKWSWFEERIVKDHYPKLKLVFSSPATVKDASDEEMMDAMAVIHSFLERRRYYPEGLNTLKREFIKRNTRGRINDSLIYLVFGKDEIIKRMCNLIFNGSYKLAEFGRSNVQELVGWVNSQDIPVINGRTTKILHYFGYKVKQL